MQWLAELSHSATAARCLRWRRPRGTRSCRPRPSLPKAIHQTTPNRQNRITPRRPNDMPTVLRHRQAHRPAVSNKPAPRAAGTNPRCTRNTNGAGSRTVCVHSAEDLEEMCAPHVAHRAHFRCHRTLHIRRSLLGEALLHIASAQAQKTGPGLAEAHMHARVRVHARVRARATCAHSHGVCQHTIRLAART